MTWKINWSDDAVKTLRKLDKPIQRHILNYLDDRIVSAKHPCDFGKPLRYDKYGLWRYRVNDHRVVCQIRDHELVILVLQIGHRKAVYR